MSLQMQEGSAIVPYLQTNKLTCNHFMDVGSRQEIPRSETKDFISHSISSHQSINICYQFPEPQFPLGNVKKARYHLHTQRVALQKNFELRETTSLQRTFFPKEDIIFITLDSKQTCSLLWMETLSLASKAIHYTNSLEKIGTKVASSTAHKMCRNG